MTNNPFMPATRRTVKARIALEGPAGSGKTFTGLALAAGMADGGKVAVLDTEKGSASTYADEFAFDVLELAPPFSPDRYVEAIHAAEAAGYTVILIDSLSHAWFDEGGVLDIVDKEASRGGNKFTAWAKGTPAQNSLVGAIVRSPIHVVATMRTKTEYVQETSNGRTTIRKVGLAPIQRDGIDFEFTVVGSISVEHVLTITKSRFRKLQDQTYRKPGPDLAEAILAELNSGAESGGQLDVAAPEQEKAGTTDPADSTEPASEAEPARSEPGQELEGPVEVETSASGPATPEQFDRLLTLYGGRVNLIRASGVKKLSEVTFGQAEKLILEKAGAPA